MQNEREWQIRKQMKIKPKKKKEEERMSCVLHVVLFKCEKISSFSIGSILT